jgi:hypothetical protein
MMSRVVTVAGSLLNSDKKYMRRQFKEYDAFRETFGIKPERQKLLTIEQARVSKFQAIRLG